MPGPGEEAQSGLGSGKLPYGMEEVEELGSLCVLAMGTLPLRDYGEAEATHSQQSCPVMLGLTFTDSSWKKTKTVVCKR